MSYQVRNAKRLEGLGTDAQRWERDRATERGPCLRQQRTDMPFSTVEALQAFCDVNNRQLDYANEYGEPGYSDPTKGILFSDWNDIPESLQKRLESQGYELEWEDEWIVDSDNGSKAYRVSPDSHGWEPRVRAGDGFYLTPDSDPQEWIDDSLNEKSRPLPSWFDDSELVTRSFGLLEGRDKEVGFHPGQNETPDKFMPALRAEGYDVILQVTDRGQFDVSYRIWTRKEAERICVVDGSFGIYVPQRFAQKMRGECVLNVTPADFDELEKGPDVEGYDDLWGEILETAVWRDEATGISCRFEQDSDVFAIDVRAEYNEDDDTYYVSK